MKPIINEQSFPITISSFCCFRSLANPFGQLKINTAPMETRVMESLVQPIKNLLSDKTRYRIIGRENAERGRGSESGVGDDGVHYGRWRYQLFQEV